MKLRTARKIAANRLNHNRKHEIDALKRYDKSERRFLTGAAKTEYYKKFYNQEIL